MVGERTRAVRGEARLDEQSYGGESVGSRTVTALVDGYRRNGRRESSHCVRAHPRQVVVRIGTRVPIGTGAVTR